MYCLTNLCYVCLRKKHNLISSVNCSVSVNEELRRIIGYFAFNLPWLKTKRIILICKQCYSLLRETYQFMKMWHTNSALLQGYIDLLNTMTMPNTGNEAELLVHVDIKQTDINDVKREVKLEDEQINTFQWEHNIEETKEEFLNLEDSCIKEENTWQREELNNTEECPTVSNWEHNIEGTKDALVDFEDALVKEIIYKKQKVAETEACTMVNNSTEIIEETTDMSVNLEDSSVKEDNIRIRKKINDTEEYPMNNNSNESTDNELEFAGKQMLATNKDDLKTATKMTYKCSTCSKSFITKTELNIHARIHTDKRSYECAICKKRVNQKGQLVSHMRQHTGEKPYECATCKKSFTNHSSLLIHIRRHTGEKPYECAVCKKCFIDYCHLVRHIQTHTGEKPYECVTCKKCFSSSINLKGHMLVHTGEIPFKCSKCSLCFRHKSSLKTHIRNKHPDD